MDVEIFFFISVSILVFFYHLCRYVYVYDTNGHENVIKLQKKIHEYKIYVENANLEMCEKKKESVLGFVKGLENFSERNFNDGLRVL